MAATGSNSSSGSKSRGVRRTNGEVADWQSVNGETLKRAITAASNVGGAIRCGYSRDGGAYAIGIYGDGDPYTEFVRPSEDLNQFLLDITSLFEDIDLPDKHVEKRSK